MKYKKIMLILITAIFLASIASVCAADANDTLVASEDTNTIGLSVDKDIIEDNLQTSEENDELTLTDNDVLGVDSATYSDLASEIGQSGNVKLTHKNYTYNTGATAITITEDNKVIDGNGAVIDMNGSTIRAFYISGSGVTIKNLTIKNANYNGNGGAIYFTSSGTVTNCNFANNHASGGGGAINMGSGTVSNCNFTGNNATYYGGAVYFRNVGEVTNCNFTGNNATGDYARGGAIFFVNTGTVTNCNFTDNSATVSGGAVYFYSAGNVTNCNFTNNKATRTGNYDGGGAVYFRNVGEVTNCNFADNSASQGGAIYSNQQYTTADTCIFKRNSGDNVKTVIYPPTLNVNNFTTVHGSGEKLTFDLKTNSSIPVTNGNISISVYFKGNGEWVRNYTCLSGEGWIPDLPVGSYIAFFDTEYAEFQKINRTITITAPEHTFWFLNYTINGNDNHVIELSHDFYFDPAYDAAFVNGIVINRPVTIKGNGYAIDGQGKSRIFNVTADNVTLKNITFKNGNCTGDGGAIYFCGSGTVENCNFTNNKANGTDGRGGAVYLSKQGTVTNCNFTNNKATVGYCLGGAIFMNSGTVENCNFTDNTAKHGGAICFNESGTVENCYFTYNQATGIRSWGGAIFFLNQGTVLNCNFANNYASFTCGAVFFHGNGNVTNCNFTNNSAIDAGAVYSNDEVNITNCNFVYNKATGDGGAIEFFGRGNVINCNFTNNSASNAGAVLISMGKVINCTFINNAAESGGVIYFLFQNDGLINGSVFINNTKNIIFVEHGGNITTINSWFGNNATNYNIKPEAGNVTMNNWLFLNATADSNVVSVFNSTGIVFKLFIYNATSQNVSEYNNTLLLPIDLTITSTNGYVDSPASNLGDSIRYAATRVGDGSVTAKIENIVCTIALKNIKANPNLSAPNQVITYGENATIALNYNTNATGKVNITLTGKKSILTYLNLDLNAKIVLPNDIPADEYDVSVLYSGDENFLNATANATLTVNKASTEITVNPASLELFVGDETVIFANLTPDGAGNVTFTSSNDTIVDVDNQGNVIAQGKGQAIITVSFAGDNNYAAAENRTITVTVSLDNASVTVVNDTLDLKIGETYAINATKHPDTIMLDITYTSSNNAVATVDGKGIVTAVGEGTAIITVEVGDDEIYAKNSTNVTVTVSKVPTEIDAKSITATYNINRDLVITLKDADGNPLAGVEISVDLNGAKTYTTDTNGQAKVSTLGLAPKTYTAKINFEGNTTYNGSSAEVKVVINKATPKITAKKKTYKAKKKTKKFTITLKDNTGKPIKNAKVRLMVKKVAKKSKKKSSKMKSKSNKKKNYAKTNSKGKATFKVLKNKKGKYNAKVKFYGDQYYNKATKTVKITIR